MVYLWKFQKVPDGHLGLDLATAYKIDSLETLLQISNQVSCDVQSFDDDSANRRLKEPLFGRDTHAAESSSNTKHIGRQGKSCNAAGCDNDGICTSTCNLCDLFNDIGGLEVDVFLSPNLLDESLLLRASVYANYPGPVRLCILN